MKGVGGLRPPNDPTHAISAARDAEPPPRTPGTFAVRGWWLADEGGMDGLVSVSVDVEICF